MSLFGLLGELLRTYFSGWKVEDSTNISDLVSTGCLLLTTSLFWLQDEYLSEVSIEKVFRGVKWFVGVTDAVSCIQTLDLL